MTNSIYQEIICRLVEAQIPSPRLEARILLGEAAHLDPNCVNDETILTPQEIAKLGEMLKMRLLHKPLDKILKRREFYKYTFLVDETVLTPRPDTEILVEAANTIIKNNKINKILDMGTGSGCILLSLLKDNPQLRGTGIDKSPKALATAQKNCRLLGLEQQARFVCTDWFDNKFLDVLPESFDLIASNPPYIPTHDISGLDGEVKNYDPMLALDGGADGLQCYRQIAAVCPRLLNPNGYLLLEIGIGQAADVIHIFQKQKLCHISTLRDLSGIERCIIFRKKDCN